MKHYISKFLIIFTITLIVGLLLFGVLVGGSIMGYWGNVDELDVESLTMRQNSVIVYNDPDTGEEKELKELSAEENRVWVNIENTPEHLQKAFVSIEDERFYEHRGFDLKRTIKATITWIWDKVTGKTGAASLGGSTITQQLIKNITGEDQQTAARKFQEISRAVALEKQMEKDQIMELYLNCIYLAQGCNGVQTASNLYFDKDVKDLSIAESAAIAGITKFPSLYDPFVNPDKNKQRQELVLSKMLELGHITQDEYNTAISEKLNFADPEAKASENEPKITSYYVDQIIRDVLRDLQAKGYSEALANRILYSGGVKIRSAYNPKMQGIIEDYYSKASNFGNTKAQSAMVVTDVRTGQVVAIAGGIGEKEGSLTLNRASMSTRQPGSTMKPIAVYAPAMDMKLITAGSTFDDAKKSYNGWSPRNYDFAYRGRVDARRALRTSLNTVPVEILNRMGAQASYDFLTEKLGFTTLVERADINGTIYSDIGLSQLALGGLTYGTTVMEIAAAYGTFANNGMYQKPYTYMEITDKDGNVVIASDRTPIEALKPSTAFIMSQMLREVVTSGTGRGAGLSSVSFTAGKTGTTSDNKDRWFVGFTPYYSAAVWYGYDIPQEIWSSSNPCIPVFRNVMDKIHRVGMTEKRSIQQPADVIRATYCKYSGMKARSGCPSESYYFAKDNISATCNSNHAGYVPEDEEGEEDEDEKKPETSATPSPSATATSGTTSTSAPSSTGSAS